MYRLLLLAALAALAALALLGPSVEAACACPTPKTQANFDADKYLGLWYEMKRVTRGYEKDGQCGTALYQWTDNTKTAVNVLNTNYVPSLDANYTVNLLAKPVVLAEGKLSVTWPSQPQVPSSNYWVLGTDYRTYSVVYSCGEPADEQLPSITLWVLARNPAAFDANTAEIVNGILKNSGFEQNDLVTLRHDCPAPECKPCASSKTNLDAAKMAGRWWEVQHSPFSTGSSVQSCAIADVSGTSDGVSIVFQNHRNDLGKDEKETMTCKLNKNGEFSITGGMSGDPDDRFCVVDTDYENWAVLSVCGKAFPQYQNQLPPGFTKATVGGVYVMARTRGLSPEHQMQANRAVINTGLAASSMETTRASPCPAAAFDNPSSASSASGLAAPALAALVLAAIAARRPL